jgi:hypothetical protein
MSSTQYADEGTIAHALAAMCLRENTDAAAYVGRIIEEQDYPHSPLGPSGAPRWMYCSASAGGKPKEFVERKFSMEVTDEMAEHVQTYLDSIRTYTAGGVALIETSLDISHILGHYKVFNATAGEIEDKPQGGTGDVIALVDDELQVHDLKFGKGVEVFADRNEQMQLYALGALPLVELLGDVERVRHVIHQPRIKSAPDEWDCTVGELREFAETAKKAADRARSVMGTPLKHLGLEYFAPSDKACRFCPHKADCPALEREVGEAVFDDFDVIGNPHETAAPREIPAESKRLGALMDKVDLIEDFCRAVRAKSDLELHAGNPPIGKDGPYKLVAGKKGNRVWIDKAEVEALMKGTFRMKQDDMYTRTLITPPAAQELLKKEQPKRWAKLAAHITQSDGKKHVAPASDPRPALAPSSATADDFDVI